MLTEKGNYAKKPDSALVRAKVAEINRLCGGKVQIEEWEHNGQGGLRVLMTWRYQTGESL